MEEFYKKKSCLRNAQVKEIKDLEKRIKKKKGSQKEELENELDELVKKHETELKLLEKEYNITSSLKKGIDRVENDEKETQQKTEIFSTDTLASMSGKQLRELAVKCQLGKNGSREELLTKLIVFYGELSHKKKESEKENLMPRDDKNQNRNLLFNKYVTPAISEDFYLKKVDTTNELSKNNLIVKASASSLENKHSVSETTSESDTSSAHDFMNDKDVPDMQKQLGSGKEDTHSSRKLKYGKQVKTLSTVKKAPYTVKGSSVTLTEEQRQKKREKVMQQVLLKLMTRFPKGLPVDHIASELQAIDVRNFTPQLCGYANYHEWLAHQPVYIIRYNAATQTIFPSQSIPSSLEDMT